MAFDLIYSDDADQCEIDRAIIEALGKREGYVIEVTTLRPFSTPGDVVVVRSEAQGDVLVVRIYSEEAGAPIGPELQIHTVDIIAIKIY